MRRPGQRGRIVRTDQEEGIFGVLDSNTNADWEWYGRNDPYYGVVSWEDYRRDRLDEAAREAFFRGGEDHVERMTGQILRWVGDGFRPRRVLDFGCGVGRITIPLARRYPEVVGADISPSMLEHARTHCRDMGIDNAVFVESGGLDRTPEQFDLIHSYIVFQHIPVERGYEITRMLLGLLAPGGIGVLHYTYRQHATGPLRGKILLALYRHVPFAYRLRRLLKREPVMQMNEYDLNLLLSRIQDAGSGSVHLGFTDHGCRGAVLMFQKRRDVEPC